MPDPKISIAAVLASATSRRQQKLVGYRVNGLGKSTEGNYVAKGARQNGTHPPANLNA